MWHYLESKSDWFYTYKYYCTLNKYLITHLYIISEMLETPYYIHYSPTRMTMHKMVTSKYFDLAISAVIGLNVITMAMEFYMMPVVCILNFSVLKIGSFFLNTNFIFRVWHMLSKFLTTSLRQYLFWKREWKLQL